MQTTFELLGATPNDAAVNVLIPALDSGEPAIAEGALSAIFERRSVAGQREVLRRLHTINDRWRLIIEQARGRMSQALRDALLSGDRQLCVNACQAILWLREYDLMPALINALEDQSNEHAGQACDTLLELADRLYEEIAAPRDYRERRDPQIVRRNVAGCLELSVSRFSHHKQKQVVESFLLLVNRDNAALKQILMDPHHASYLPTVDVLLHSQRVGVMRLVLSYLEDRHAPMTCINVLTRRCDPPFIQNLLERIGDSPSGNVAVNLKRIVSIPWIDDQSKVLDELDAQSQARVVRLIAASGMKRLEAFATIQYLLRQGKVEARRVAVQALVEFTGADANALAIESLEDDDPQVQAGAVAQLRSRGIPGALGKIIERLDSPHTEVVEAARASLSEFRFARFLASYDTLEDNVRRSTGMLVKRVDPETGHLVSQELISKSRTRRLRGLDVVYTIELIDLVEGSVIDLLLGDEDHVVRIEAARALGGSRTAAAQGALGEALADRSVMVQEAAQESLEHIDHTLHGS